MTCGIYKIFNKKTKKFYIGSSINIKKRWYKHKSLLRHNKHENKHLQNAWNLDGEESFEFIIIACVIEETLLKEEEERFIIETKSYDNKIGYNKTRYTYCPNRGKKLSTEQIEHLRKINSGRKHTEETKKRIALANKGKIVTEETKEKMSIAKKGKAIKHQDKLNESRKTESFRKKLSEFAKTRTGTKNPNSKLTLEQIKEILKDLKNNELTIGEIAEKNKISRSTIKRIKYGKSYINILKEKK